MANRSGIVVVIGTSPTTYQWLLNGEVISTASTYTVSDFEPGRYTLEAKLVRNGSTIANTIHEFVVFPALDPPVLELDFIRNSDNNVVDLISGKIFSPIDTTGYTTVLACSSTGFVKSYLDMHYLSCMDYQGVIQCNNAIDGQYDDYYGEIQGLKQYTLTFLTRLTNPSGGGAHSYFQDGTHWRYYSGSWDSCSSEETVWNQWVRLTITQERTLDNLPSRRTYEWKGYVNKTLSDTTVLDYSPNGYAIPIGLMRIGAYSSDGRSFNYPGEIANLKIYDYPLTSEQISQLCDCDGELSTVGYYSALDLGNINRSIENASGDPPAGQSWLVTSTGETDTGNAGNCLAHWFDGDTCWCTADIYNALNKTTFWVHGEFYYPASIYSSGEPIIPGHPFPGNTTEMIGLCCTTARNDWAAILNGLFHYDTQTITLYQFAYQRTNSSGYTYVSLDGREITQDEWHSVEIYYNLDASDGDLICYYDGEELVHITGQIERTVNHYQAGFNLGTHIQPPGNVFYSRNHYLGDLRYSEYLTYLNNLRLAQDYENNLRFVGMEDQITEEESMSLSTESI